MTFLCRSDDLAEGEGLGISLGEGIARREILLVRKNGLFAYVNACPHQGTPLETFPGRVFTADGKELLCSTHGARFRIEDGKCVWGPCLGKALSPLSVIEDAGEINLVIL